MKNLVILQISPCKVTVWTNWTPNSRTLRLYLKKKKKKEQNSWDVGVTGCEAVLLTGLKSVLRVSERSVSIVSFINIYKNRLNIQHIHEHKKQGDHSHIRPQKTSMVIFFSRNIHTHKTACMRRFCTLFQLASFVVAAKQQRFADCMAPQISFRNKLSTFLFWGFQLMFEGGKKKQVEMREKWLKIVQRSIMMHVAGQDSAGEGWLGAPLRVRSCDWAMSARALWIFSSNMSPR